MSSFAAIEDTRRAILKAMQRNINYTFETQDELLNSFSVLQIAQLDLLGALMYSSDNLVVQKASSDDSSEPGAFLPIVGPLIDVILSLLRSAGEGSNDYLPFAAPGAKYKTVRHGHLYRSHEGFI